MSENGAMYVSDTLPEFKGRIAGLFCDADELPGIMRQWIEHALRCWAVACGAPGRDGELGAATVDHLGPVVFTGPDGRARDGYGGAARFEKRKTASLAVFVSCEATPVVMCSTQLEEWVRYMTNDDEDLLLED